VHVGTNLITILRTWNNHTARRGEKKMSKLMVSERKQTTKKKRKRTPPGFMKTSEPQTKDQQLDGGNKMGKPGHDNPPVRERKEHRTMVLASSRYPQGRLRDVENNTCPPKHGVSVQPQGGLRSRVEMSGEPGQASAPKRRTKLCRRTVHTRG